MSDAVASSSYAFLRTPRWYGIIAAAIAVACVCALLGYWQLTRYQGRAAEVNLVAANYDQDPVPLTELVSSATGDLHPGDEWRQVLVRGQYTGNVLVLPQRGVQGSPADHVVALFAAQLDTGESWAILVDRGWYRTDTFADHTAAQRLPGGEREVVLRLRHAEGLAVRTLAEGQIHRLNPEQAAAAATPGADLAIPLATGFYGQVAAETAAGADDFPDALELLPRPTADLGSHLSYAFQWWVFALGALGAVVILARREARDPGSYTPRRTSSDDEDEDIEAQLQASATRST